MHKLAAPTKLDVISYFLNMKHITKTRVTFMQERKKHFLIKCMDLSENAGYTWNVEEI